MALVYVFFHSYNNIDSCNIYSKLQYELYKYSLIEEVDAFMIHDINI